MSADTPSDKELLQEIFCKYPGTVEVRVATRYRILNMLNSALDLMDTSAFNETADLIRFVHRKFRN